MYAPANDTSDFAAQVALADGYFLALQDQHDPRWDEFTWWLEAKAILSRDQGLSSDFVAKCLGEAKGLGQLVRTARTEYATALRC